MPTIDEQPPASQVAVSSPTTSTLPAPPETANSVPPPASLEEQGSTATPDSQAQFALATTNPVTLPAAQFSPAVSELQRGVALRFVKEIVVPQIARAPDDPVARRGAALFMTGAMLQLAAVSNIDPAATMSLIAPALGAALPRHAVDAFTSHYDAHVSTEANLTIIDAGRQAMTRFLAGQSNEGVLTQGLAIWRVPKPAGIDQTMDNNAGKPTDYYVMTDMRGGAGVMDLHNLAMRETVEANDGCEVKHTGRGILARFETAEAAIEAAISITNRLTASLKIPETVFFAAAVVPGYGTADDPLLSAQVTKSAQLGIESAPRSGVICHADLASQVTHASAYQSQDVAPHWLTVNRTAPRLLTVSPI